jgi:chaperonin GroEL
VEEGIVPGGGVALLNVLPALDGVEMAQSDQQTGVSILRRALEAPMRKIAQNAGQNGDVIIQNVRRAQEESGDTSIGYNVMTGEYVNMLEAGIIDPAKVTRGALENAASIASMILTTEALITDIPEDEPEMPAGAGGPGGPGGMGF